MIRREDVVSVGKFAKPHGVKGEIALVTTCEGLFEESDDPYLICDMDGILVPFFVKSWRPKSVSVMLVTLENVNDEADVRRFVNQTVYYPKDAIPQSSDDMDTWASFIGYSLVDEHQGKIGVIKGVDDSTINVLFNVDCGEKERLIPVSESLVRELNEEEHTLTVALPEGILDL